MRFSSSGADNQSQEGEQRCLNSELWHACAGPLVSLPAVGSRVVYFPQGHSEQVSASTNKQIDAHFPNYPSLPPQLICHLHNVTMHADIETDEVYAQMTLQPLSQQQEQKDPYLPAEMGTPSKQPTNYFCKTLTASDTSTHGGFSVPRRAAEKVFPPLDFSQTPPVQELIARDLHDNEWKFRHIFRGQPKRHLLTTGWSVFVSAKRLVAGDSVLFIWNESNKLFLGIRRASRPQTVMPLSVLSSDTMHIGLLAAAAHAVSTDSRFTIFFNPRASPSEFVIPLAKYVNAVCHTRVSVGMRFRMLFETEESSVRRYMGTITGIGDLDPTRWPNSHWRSVKVGWDESTAGERQPRVSLWEIEPLTTFPMYPTPFPLSLKRPWPVGPPSLHGDRGMQSLSFQGMGMSPWMPHPFNLAMLGIQPEMYQAMASAAFQELRTVDLTKQSMLRFQQQSQIMTPQILQQMQPQSQQALLRIIQHAQAQNQTIQSQSQLFQQHTQNNHSLNNSQVQVQQQQQHLQQLLHQQQQERQRYRQWHGLKEQEAEKPQPSNNNSQQTSSFVSSPQSQHSSLPEVTCSGISPLHSILRPCSSNERPNVHNSMLSSEARPNKRLAVETQPNNSPNLAPFPRRVCTLDPKADVDPHSSMLFSANVEDTALLLQNNEIVCFRNIGIENDLGNFPFSTENFLSNTVEDFPFNQALTTSNCIEESGFVESADEGGQINPQGGTFVKVYKSGSFGRSLDLKKFTSYPELRYELGRLFGLEGQLEDPLRSGWQLVFVDRENDVLLVGDDPWQEFVDNVSCIKLLSPQEVVQMGKEGDELLNAFPLRKLSDGSNCDDHLSNQDRRNNGITPVLSLDD